MKFRHELRYDASPADVFEMLADPAFREASCAAQDVLSAEVHLERDGNGFSLTIDQQQKTDDLPSFARTFAGDSTRAIQREEWEDSTGGTLHIETNGLHLDEIAAVGFDPTKADNRILAAALGQCRLGPTVVVSNDAALRIKASQVGLEAIEFRRAVSLDMGVCKRPQNEVHLLGAAVPGAIAKPASAHR